MSVEIEIKVPVLPESVSDATISFWHKKPGDIVHRDEHLVDIETDKVVLEVVSPADGTIEKIIHEQGATVKAQETIAIFKKLKLEQDIKENQDIEENKEINKKEINKKEELSPSVRRIINENKIDISNITGSGKDGRIKKQDVQNFLNINNINNSNIINREKRVPMSRLRAKIAERLLYAQQNAAILTTFNEINMKHVIDLRNQYKDIFEKKHGVRLGFMSFFVMAVVESLKNFPVINAAIDGKDIVYHEYFDIGIAVASPRGLVVPIIRDADKLTMPEIERQISQFSKKAQDGQLNIDDIKGGTFTISNGGVFGSLLSTPILNPPQTGILGMHKIEQRPIVENDNIVIRPMMYVALSYDHRIVDGAESVQFLVNIKNILEEPARTMLHV